MDIFLRIHLSFHKTSSFYTVAKILKLQVIIFSQQWITFQWHNLKEHGFQRFFLVEHGQLYYTYVLEWTLDSYFFFHCFCCSCSILWQILWIEFDVTVTKTQIFLLGRGKRICLARKSLLWIILIKSWNLQNDKHYK